MTRVMIIADLHCGHEVGLTPPDWDTRPGDGYGSKAYEFHRQRRESYKWYSDLCKVLKPDIAIINGDAVDGKGTKSGATELLTADRNEQCDMAAACIQEMNAPRIVMSRGSPYHTGLDEDWEDQIAKSVNAEKISNEDDIKVGNIVINYRHHASRSSIPHGRGTPLAKENLWNDLKAQRGENPRADIIIRSHTHYFAYIGEADWLAVSTPALQGYGSKYGEKIVTGTVDFGICYFDIEEDNWGWHWKIKRFRRKHKFALVA